MFYDKPMANYLFGIIYEEDLKDRIPLGTGKVDLIHYTSASAACSIISGGEIWLTNVRQANDFYEIQYGIDLIREYFQNPEEVWRKEAFSTLGLGNFQEFADRLEAPLQQLYSETYVTCLSEHHNDDEHHGRLSMWRGYGASESVALVISGGPFATFTDSLGVFSVKVKYWKQDRLDAYLDALFRKLLVLDQKAVQEVQTELEELLHQHLLLLPLSLKHPGFDEEREWRVFHFPYVAENSVLKKEVKTLGGVSQLVQILPLKDYSEIGAPDLSIPSIFLRTIIGPSEYQYLTARALDMLLSDAGIQQPNAVITLSSIPYRRK